MDEKIVALNGIEQTTQMTGVEYLARLVVGNGVVAIELEAYDCDGQRLAYDAPGVDLCEADTDEIEDAIREAGYCEVRVSWSETDGLVTLSR